MKPRLAIALLLIVLLPLSLITWLGYRAAQHEQARVAEDFRALYAGQLDQVRSAVAGAVAKAERELQAAVDFTPALPPGAIRQRLRDHRLARQFFILDWEGKLLYPALDGDRTDDELTFLTRTKSIWQMREPFFAGGEPGAAAQIKGSYWVAGRDHGWHSWFYGSGANFLYWRSEPPHVVGAEVNRAAFLAEVVAALPSSLEGESALGSARIVLSDASGKPIYQWGDYAPAGGEVPQVGRPLAAPVEMWTLAYFAAPNSSTGGARLPLLGGIGALAIALVALAAYFYREHSREMRAAAQRVSFVNQVSHELKTPLTNIRMYAELLEERLAGNGEGPEDESARHSVGVVVAESQRLSRLINNVLTFAKQDRGGARIHRAPRVPDDAVRDCLEHFRPAVEARGMALSFQRGAAARAQIDADAIEQILGNLIGNAEKYAARGEIRVRAQQDGDTLVLRVEDDGPGIPPDKAEAIFLPFERLSDQVTEGVSGAGIGLPIARELARLHGGDLRLVPGKSGAIFEAKLHAPLA